MFRGWIFNGFGFLLLVLAVGTGFFLWRPTPDSSIALPTSVPTVDTSVPTLLTKPIQAQDIPGIAAPFTFTAEIPRGWQAEAIGNIEAVSLFDPASPDDNSLEQSQIFIRYFRANDFLTLSTVTIHSQTPLTIAGRPAVRYDISKKPTAASFSNQPRWRNERHSVTDMRVSDRNPSIFYVIAKRPGVSEEVFERFLETLEFE